MGILETRLTEALDAKKNDSSNFVWKGAKHLVNGVYEQEEKKLIDCSERELQEHYDYCKQMLYNKDNKKPGRFVLLTIIKDQIERCNCELFLRYVKKEIGKDRFTLIAELNNVLNKNIEKFPDPSELTISSMMTNIPDEFKSLRVDMIIKAGCDNLGYFNAQHITRTFILKQGVWLTSNELRDLTIKNPDGSIRDRLEVIKENLGLRENVKLRMTPRGLSYAQLRSMIILRSNKYSELSSDQLETLRNKVLFLLEEDCKFHIQEWKTRMDQIEQVATEKKCLLIME